MTCPHCRSPIRIYKTTEGEHFDVDRFHLECTNKACGYAICDHETKEALLTAFERRPVR